MKTIDEFTGAYAFFSNFWPVPIIYEGLHYPSVEHAYQAAKTHDHAVRSSIAALSTAKQAKARGRTVALRPDWEDVKVNVMRDLLRLKFAYADLRDNLLATGDAQLVEGNWWRDFFWGVCDGRGKNMLGKLLMEVRAEIVAERQRD